jgi:hypothetical protein
MSLRDGELAHHIRRLGNHELNELLLQLPKASFAALVEVALARPVLPAGLVLRFEPTPGVAGWTVVACAPRRAWTRTGGQVQLSGISSWRRRGDAAAALAWVTPVSGARCLALAAYVRALPEAALHQLLAALSRERFDQLVEVAYRPEGTAA